MSVCGVDLALQGGGSHGAFTWGVLDRFLEDRQIQIGGLSGTSAGAMNAVVLASGFGHGGPEGARAALAAFWKQIGKAGSHGALGRKPFDMLFQPWMPGTSATLKFFDVMSR
ncbi:MAG: patatin-like phospholipase family protein, partial [Gammaproteobacteria bacterium]|nr:patatin-like phospholipase family protein [Gammaproteobacteria bacterium]